jgi:hypothetical protein
VKPGRRRLTVSLLGLLCAMGAAVCSRRPEVVPPAPAPPLQPVSVVAEDTSHKEEPRLVPVESYVRTYLSLFGGLSPLDAQKKARGADRALLFDVWDDYLTTLGVPDYRIDLPRGGQTNALMLAAFERIGAALCDRALEHDWKSKPAVAVDQRLIYAFEPGPDVPTKARFAEGFDVLHRTFLGYPATVAPTDRLARFHKLFEGTVARHAAAEAGASTANGAPASKDAPAAKGAPPKSAPRSRLSPIEAGWVTVCEGLVRHPEFHFY